MTAYDPSNDYREQVAEEAQAERDGYRPHPAASRFYLDRAEHRYERNYLGW